MSSEREEAEGRMCDFGPANVAVEGIGAVAGGGL
jgi:hypothetical protein